MRVGMLSSDWGDFAESLPGGCTNIRMFVPAQALVQNGVFTIIGEFGWREDEGFVVVPTIQRVFCNNRGPILEPKEYVGELDVIIIKLWMWHEYEYYIKRAQEMGQTIIADIDDWFSGLPPTNIAFETTHPKRDPLWNRNHMISSYRHLNGLITSTKFLNDYYSNYNANVIQIDNSLDPNAFIRRYDVSRDKPVIGWVGMMLWRKHDIVQLQGWLGNFLEDYDLRFYQAGLDVNDPTEFARFAKINPDRFYGVSGCSAKNYGNILTPIDIGIVPLEKNSFNEAKSSLKGMEYSFTGIPFIASDTEEYKRIVSEGAGNLAKRPRDWVRHLERLLDPAVRREESDRGYQTVLENYNINVVVNKWIDTIEYIKSRNPKAR